MATPEDVAAKERSRSIRDWSALKDACRKTHSGGPVGQAVCVCGAASGGSAACSMLGTIRAFLMSLESGDVPESHRAMLAGLQEGIH